MVPLSGNELNTIFDQLAEWNEILKLENVDFEDLEP